ncbi:MAG TPA: MCP four helix bundle domain-containing protein, partial [Candidatus Sulfopaludibacter sp.]|nr:MCP four helix bundle domain-containing protein [Candidatus Sulfopaludibacter sp.]
MALGLFAYSQVGGIQKNSAIITSNSLPGVYLLGQVQNGIQKEFALVLQSVYSTDRAEIDRMAGEIKESRTLNAARRETYQKLITSDRQRALFDALMAARNIYVDSYDAVLQISASHTSQSHQQAIDLVNRNVKPAEQKYLEAAANLVAGNQAVAEEDGKNVQEAVGGARTGVLAGLGAALLAAVCISLFIVRSITRPLAGAVELVGHVARGDLTRTVEVTSNDEIGAMLAAMNGMLANLRKTVSEVTSAAINVASG